MIERLIHKALYHHINNAVPKALPVDGLAYFTALNYLNMVLTDKSFYTKPQNGLLETLPDESEVFVTPVYQKGEDARNYYVLIAKLVLSYHVETKGNLPYYFDVFGSHNKKITPKADLKDKTGTLILPFNLIATVDKTLMPIDVMTALIQNPLHECFSYKLSPSPATSLAIEHDLQKQMAFITHPKMLHDFFEVEHKEQLDAIHYDTRLALDILKSKYNISINEKTMQEVAEIDKKLSQKNGVACIEITT